MSTPKCVVIGLVLLLATGCGGSRPSSEIGKKAAAPAPMTAPAPKAITSDDALKAVSQLPAVIQYGRDATAAGRRLVVALSDPTPTRFIVMVGSADSTRSSITRWYLVSKADGTITEWSMAKGPLPKD